MVPKRQRHSSDDAETSKKLKNTTGSYEKSSTASTSSGSTSAGLTAVGSTTTGSTQVGSSKPGSTSFGSTSAGSTRTVSSQTGSSSFGPTSAGPTSGVSTPFVTTQTRLTPAGSTHTAKPTSGGLRSAGSTSAGSTSDGSSPVEVLFKGHPEFDKIASSLQWMKLTAIYRVRNAEIRQQYEKKKAAMMATSGGSVEERALFHGTTMENAFQICQQNFDPSRCKHHVFGIGSYFATSAATSHTYAPPSVFVDGRYVRYMLLASVLVGRYACGQENYTCPPQIGTKTTQSFFDWVAGTVKQLLRYAVFQSSRAASCEQGPRYDSCVDNPGNPAIFVVFSPEQCCPEYVLEF